MYAKTYQLKRANESASAQELLSIIAEALRRHKPKHVEQRENSIEFKAGSLRIVSSWNLLVAITSGTVVFTDEECRLQYSLSFAELYIFGVVATGFGLVAASLGGAPRPVLIAFPIMVWLWLVGIELCCRDHSF